MNVLPGQIAYHKESKSAIEYGLLLEAMQETANARRVYPWWPTDIVHATVIMCEEAGEALKVANEIRWNHKDATLAHLHDEVMHTMAMCIRLMIETPGLAQARHPEKKGGLEL